jgi:hypothetical protein
MTATQKVNTIISECKKHGFPQSYIFSTLAGLVEHYPAGEICAVIPKEYLTPFRDWVQKIDPKNSIFVGSGPAFPTCIANLQAFFRKEQTT